MPVTNSTPNFSIALPDASNTLDFDVLRLIAALGTVDTVLATLAAKASPALTGTPTAPTAAGGTNTTQIATTAFVKAAIDALIAAAPGALDTLDELAAALGDDANFATTITNALALKAPLASPTFTGTAVTALLQILGGASGSVTAVAASAVDCSAGNYFTKTASGALTWTTTNVPASGKSYGFVLKLTNGGAGIQTWMSGIKWHRGVAPTLTASGVDFLGFVTDDGGTTWHGAVLRQDSK